VVINFHSENPGRKKGAILTDPPYLAYAHRPYTSFILNPAGKPIINSTRLEAASIRWDEHDHPYSRQYGDIYSSSADPQAESRHVFIDGNRLTSRFASLSLKTFTIGECGFGFGLNFLLTCEHFCQLAPPGTHLHFISTELHPVPVEDMWIYYQSTEPALQALAAAFLSQYEDHSHGQHRYHLDSDNRRITLDLCLGDALEAFNALRLPRPMVDAWFLDGFSPAKNQALWQPALFTRLAILSKSGATLATYSAAGEVRRQLTLAGFVVEKALGFGSKRHMLTGQLSVSPAQIPLTPGWTHPYTDPARTVSHVTVIGAGLAGCATAHALAQRGLKVTLLDKGDALACGASGNPRGIVHFNPGLQADPGNRFRLACYLFALRHYQQLQKSIDIGWQASGLWQLAAGTTEQRELQRVLDKRLFAEAVLSASPNGHSASGLDDDSIQTALCFPGAGSLDPGALCRAWSSHPNIRIMLNHEVTGIEKKTGWEVSIRANQQESRLDVDAIVICNSHDAARLAGLPAYPLTQNQGQTDTFSMDQNAVLPGTILRHKGYLIPWHDSTKRFLTIGGQISREAIRDKDSARLLSANLDLISEFAPGISDDLKHNQKHILSRQGTRCGTPDYFPLAGPVEDREACSTIYGALARNARKEIASSPSYLPGLFVNLGHGANGLTTTPLLGEYIAAVMLGEISPLSEDLSTVVHPLRYLIRDLKKQQF